MPDPAGDRSRFNPLFWAPLLAVAAVYVYVAQGPVSSPRGVNANPAGSNDTGEGP